jgi:hypothetical protein
LNSAFFAAHRDAELRRGINLGPAGSTVTGWSCSVAGLNQSIAASLSPRTSKDSTSPNPSPDKVRPALDIPGFVRFGNFPKAGYPHMADLAPTDPGPADRGSRGFSMAGEGHAPVLPTRERPQREESADSRAVLFGRRNEL